MFAKIGYYFFSILLNRIFLVLPIKKDKVLFLSDVRADISGNFYFIHEAIKNRYDVRLSLKGDRRIRRSFRQWLQQCIDLATAKYILLDDYSVSTAYIHVRKGQELVQLWHSSGAYKKFAHSRSGEHGDIKRIHAGYKRYTKTITSSNYIRECFAEAFAIPVERVCATGIPRTDIFFDEEYKEIKKCEIYRDIPEIKNKKVILFAPTYRGTKVEDANYGFEYFDLERLYHQFREEYVVLIKWHPALYNNLKFGKVKGFTLDRYSGFAFDISESREINDYLFVTEVLITDYSSLIFDYALLKKPIVYFAYDLEKYQDGRGMYYSFDEYVYGPVARNMEQLIEGIEKQEFYEEKWQMFVKKFVEKNDGHATERTVREIFGEKRN